MPRMVGRRRRRGKKAKGAPGELSNPESNSRYNIDNSG